MLKKENVKLIYLKKKMIYYNVLKNVLPGSLACTMYRVRSLIDDTRQNACIYPCNCRNEPSKVPLEAYRSHEDFDVFHVQIGHSKLQQEQFDRKEANSFRAPHFLAILAIFGGPKSRENVNFFSPRDSSQLYSMLKGN